MPSPWRGSEPEMFGDEMVNSDAKFGISLSWALSPEGETPLRRLSWVLHCSRGGGGWRWGFPEDHSIIQPLCIERNVGVKGLELLHGLQRQKKSQSFGRKWEIWSGPSACQDWFKLPPPEKVLPLRRLGKNAWQNNARCLQVAWIGSGVSSLPESAAS